MTYELDINDRPFRAIGAGTKKVEGRTLTDRDDTPYDRMVEGDTIIFTNNVTNERMACAVRFVRKYPDVRSMLTAEGTHDVLSSGLDVEGGIKSYNRLEGYEEGIKKFGIYAIGIKTIHE
jgi:ASC-1-like (ASCH) protein